MRIRRRGVLRVRRIIEGDKEEQRGLGREGMRERRGRNRRTRKKRGGWLGNSSHGRSWEKEGETI